MTRMTIPYECVYAFRRSPGLVANYLHQCVEISRRNEELEEKREARKRRQRIKELKIEALENYRPQDPRLVI